MKPSSIVGILLEDEEEFDPREYLLNPPKTPGYVVSKKGLSAGEMDYYEHSDGSRLYYDYSSTPMIRAHLVYSSETDSDDREAVGLALLKRAIQKSHVKFGMFGNTTQVRDVFSPARRPYFDNMDDDEPGSMESLVKSLERDNVIDVVDRTLTSIFARWT